MNMVELHRWLDNPTSAKELAKWAGTSVSYLRRIAKYKCKCTSEMAYRIEQGSSLIAWDDAELAKELNLKKIMRGDISLLCNSCPQHKACQKSKT